MELNEEHLKVIQESARDIDFGRITLNIVGAPHNLVDITAEKTVRFHIVVPEPTTVGTVLDRKSAGRYD
jgi:hypothetical protein